ncbi:hypothetical protein [Dyella sp.]|jgi:hypothetical protein|uniref:hypothetical protein n=1 Tax=Dyella sp. TaxID=1869338 RepID=UPI002BA1A3FB|nr:hypothetical protein [Dyella sp.]HTC28476.1 hypothetical protein [Dyella sp.]
MATGSNVVSWSLRKNVTSSRNRSADMAFAWISQLASAIEGDPSRVEEWYSSVRIRELGEMTAQELVIQDNADLVIGFLRSIRRGERE